jgi:hypothetical protein
MEKKRDTVIWPQNKLGKDIVWFSCGAASFITTKIAIQENPNVEVVYIDVGWEHEDNHRFLKEAEKALGIKVKIIKHPILATPAEVFKKRRYITSIAGAPCTQELKKRVRQKYETGLELQYFGFHAGEEKRREESGSWHPMKNSGTFSASLLSNMATQKKIVYPRSLQWVSYRLSHTDSDTAMLTV